MLYGWLTAAPRRAGRGRCSTSIRETWTPDDPTTRPDPSGRSRPVAYPWRGMQLPSDPEAVAARPADVAVDVFHAVSRSMRGADDVVGMSVVALLARGASPASRVFPAPARPCWPSRWPPRSAGGSGGCSAPPTCCPPTSPAPRCTARRRASGSSGPVRCSRTSCSSTRSTARRPARRPRCSNRWRSTRSRSTARPTRSPSRSS